jgi:hypothetical protein
VIALLALMVVAILPGLNSRRVGGIGRSFRINCVNNLRQNELALKTWAVDNNDRFPTQVAVTNGGTMELVEEGQAYVHFQVMSNELSAPKLTICPADVTRQSARSFQNGDFSNTNVSYFIGVDASDNYPAMILLGDRNVTLEGSQLKPGLIALATNSPVGWTKDIHVEQGNIGLADGSVQQVSSVRLQKAMEGNGTNRWVVP